MQTFVTDFIYYALNQSQTPSSPLDQVQKMLSKVNKTRLKDSFFRSYEVHAAIDKLYPQSSLNDRPIPGEKLAQRPNSSNPFSIVTTLQEVEKLWQTSFGLNLSEDAPILHEQLILCEQESRLTMGELSFLTERYPGYSSHSIFQKKVNGDQTPVGTEIEG